jgi:hypothetical protein
MNVKDLDSLQPGQRLIFRSGAEGLHEVVFHWLGSRPHGRNQVVTATVEKVTGSDGMFDALASELRLVPDDLLATAAQLRAIEERADLIERECPGPYTRAEAKAEIARLDERIAVLRADGTLPRPA